MTMNHIPNKHDTEIKSAEFQGTVSRGTVSKGAEFQNPENTQLKKKWLNSILSAAKWIIAITILWFMISTGRLDIKGVLKAAGSIHFLIALILVLTNALLTSLRWNLCLKAMGVQESFWSTFEYSMVGLFFNSFMPGAIGGDIVKGYLIAQNSKGKARAITSVVVDRIFGLTAILLLGFIALAINPLTAKSPELKTLTILSGLMLLCMVAFFLLSALVSRENRILKAIFDKVPMGSSLMEAYIGMNALARSWKAMTLTMIISLAVITSSVSGYIILARGAGVNESVGLFFSCVPIGFIAIVLPISPAGLGVGQGAYFNLFTWHGMAGKVGAEVFTLFQLATLLAGIVGLIFYLILRKRVDRALNAARDDS
ncbi:MAG: hypothetical protein CVV64_12115 [Candidatus Wallbacteria bacterium HGW-Wallbacteria-1]|jgi:hypothetical protein|uniref:TIGR00374 family protein n=1 Tax=Candidatus Wallbacteria bacterium HGW-Wallbacteria-1 TaxID=2013854 RepID=A0A2N1PNJ5_9BACT|nr:MAG: hypothetical protein CVV64_12115 [Candidatus Wallbacteria bacterium HGW-Wallbacteria-1]